MSTEPLEINLSSSGLSHSPCMRNLFYTVVDGYKPKAMPARMIYGIGVHKFIHVMYMTGGHIPTARAEAIKAYQSIPMLDDPRSKHLNDFNHMHAVALWTWEMCVARDEEFEILMLDDKCWYCKGQGESVLSSILGESVDDIQPTVPCTHCNGFGHRLQPAAEVTYSLPYYQDDFVKINWCGTLDRLGKIKNGIYVIPDWKTTSSWSEKEYFTQFEMSKARRGYVLALKLMAERFPDSILGEIGKGVIGTRFDGIFVKPAINDVKFARSEVYQLPQEELDEFRTLLDDKCREISQAVKTGYIPRQGLVNGSCEGKWGKCDYWVVCQKPKIIGEYLLGRDFTKKPFDPLNYNKE